MEKARVVFQGMEGAYGQAAMKTYFGEDCNSYSCLLYTSITRGIAEIARLGVKMGGAVETFSGLTGIGDLIVTCASVHSRNRKAGYLMGQGKSMQEAMDEVQMVVEGVYSAKAAVKLGEKYGVSLPIINKVSEVLFDGKDPKEAVNELMLRDNKAEHTALPWEK